jgi:mycothiol synthase
MGNLGEFPMNTSTYAIRNYRPEDFDPLSRLVAEAGKKAGCSFTISAQDVIEGLGRPYHFPESNLFVAEKAENLVGYIDVTPELEIGRVVLSYFVNPDPGGRGLAPRLIECAIGRARDLKAKRAHVNIPPGNTLARKVLRKMGFKFIRDFLELGLDLFTADVPDRRKVGPQCRHMKRGEEDQLVHIQNRSFADTWGFNPNTVEEIVYRLGLSNRSPADIILAFDAGNVVGYCWTRVYVGEWEKGKIGKGRIYMIGVDPDHRGKGVGKELLRAGLSYLESKGLGDVELTVDSNNKAARALYQSVGFGIRTRSLWYERELG